MFFLDVSHRPTQSKVPYYHLVRKSKRKRNETKRKEMKKRNNPSWNAIFLTQDYFTRTPFEFIVWRPTRRRIISARRNVLDSSGSIRKFSLLNEESQGVGGEEEGEGGCIPQRSDRPSGLRALKSIPPWYITLPIIVKALLCICKHLFCE